MTKTSVAPMQNSLGFDLNERTYIVRATTLAEFDARAARVSLDASTIAAYRAYVEYLIGTKAGTTGHSIKGFRKWKAAGRPSVAQYIAAHPVQAENRGVVKAPKAKAVKAGKGKGKGKAVKAAAPTAAATPVNARAALLQASQLLAKVAETI